VKPPPLPADLVKGEPAPAKPDADRRESISREVEKLEAAQRRLRRLALDLHDGPAQDVAALAADAALLEAGLAEGLSADDLAAARELAGEIRDRLSALGRDIRDLAEVLEPRAMLREPIRSVLAREAAAFARRSGIAPMVEVDEDLGIMTASQQIALVRVAQEALTNVREHAEATSVQLSARATANGVSLVVADDGRGFDVDAPRAEGRLGLAGMRERVLLLGGRLTIQSRPGGPTRVEATIPRWRPS
jgi:signal transduction histidine kinase